MTSQMREQLLPLFIENNCRQGLFNGPVRSVFTLRFCRRELTYTKMRRVVYIIVFTLVFATLSHGAKYAGEAFSLGVGGRGLALGGAFVAGPFDGTAPYWNPAGTGTDQGGD